VSRVRSRGNWRLPTCTAVMRADLSGPESPRLQNDFHVFLFQFLRTCLSISPCDLRTTRNSPRQLSTSSNSCGNHQTDPYSDLPCRNDGVSPYMCRSAAARCDPTPPDCPGLARSSIQNCVMSLSLAKWNRSGSQPQRPALSKAR